MKDPAELACIAALNRMYGYQPRKGLALLDKYGCASAIPGLPWQSETGALERLAAGGTHLLGCRDPEYPALLKEIPDSPIGLYVTAHTPPERIFHYERGIAIVGTRDITPYGTLWCRRIVQALARTAERPVIISGFAMGTDIIAQTEALECGLRTIGVLPCGAGSIYPMRHSRAAERLVRTEGCALVSDYPPGTPAVAGNFIRRNRIIAALADAVILIESKRRGGGLITMDFALDYGRATYALPGRLEDPCSEGCNTLIRRGKAELITDTDSLMESLGLGLLCGAPSPGAEETAQRLYGKDSLSLRILRHIRRHSGATPEEICRDLNIPYSTAVGQTAQLAGDGFIGMDLLQRCFVVK